MGETVKQLARNDPEPAAVIRSRPCFIVLALRYNETDHTQTWVHVLRYIACATFEEACERLLRIEREYPGTEFRFFEIDAPLH